MAHSPPLDTQHLPRFASAESFEMPAKSTKSHVFQGLDMVREEGLINTHFAAL
jgi:hypothetical protein